MAIISDDLPPEDPGAGSADDDDLLPGLGGSISWSWDFDFTALLDGVTGPAPWLRVTEADGPDGGNAEVAGPADGEVPDPEADEAAFQEAVAAGRARELPLRVCRWAGRRESLPTGPGLAGWLALARAADLEDGALAGVAASFRRLASWAAAGELAAVAQIASRSARTDRRARLTHLGDRTR